MKKIIIPCLCILSALSLAGCSNNDSESTITSLNNQLSRVESVVSSTSTDEIAAVSPYISLSINEPYNSIQSFRALSNANMLREEEIRHEILLMSGQLKSCTENKYKLSTKKNNALKSINANLAKYTNSLNSTKSQVKSSVNNIKCNLSNVNNINIEEATSSYVTLNNSMNERYAYLCNIYDNLEQACIILDCGCKSNENLIQNEDYYLPEIDDSSNEVVDITESKDNNEELIFNQNSEKTEEKGKIKIIKNIDSYNLDKLANDEVEETENVEENVATTQPNYPMTPTTKPLPQTPPTTNIPQTPPPMARPYPTAGNMPNSSYYNNGYGGYGYNNGYGYNYNYDRINPNRNTDTFYSLNRNIDTYRYNPNYYNNLPLYNYQTIT